MPFVVGEKIGPYRLLEQLGQGGMATVYKAYHAALDRFVAIKALHPAFMEDANFLARFQREARLVAKLEHPNIVPVYDFAEHEGRPYLVMKYIEGETLKATLQRATYQQKGLESDEIARIVEAVGAGLAYAHRQGILHRDIKPSNVLITPTNQIFLADFGLARIAQSGSSTLTSDMLIGTPQYISPEQALSQPDLDVRTDIYSFGVMLYEMVVGRVPYQADTPFSIIHDHIYTPLPLPRLVNPAVPESVERVLIKALAKDRNDRYSNVDEMVSAFNQALRSAFLPAETILAGLPEMPSPQISVGPSRVDNQPVEADSVGFTNSPAQGDAASQDWVVPQCGDAPNEFSKRAISSLDLTGAPSYTPPDLETNQASFLPASSTSITPAQVAMAQAPETLKNKNGLPGWKVIVLALVSLALCISLWAVNRSLIGLAFGILPTAAVKPSKPVLIVATPAALDVTQPAIPQDAWNTAMDALSLWQKHDYIAADTLLIRATRLAGDNAAFYNQAGDKMAASQAWVPAALMYLNLLRVKGDALSPEQFDAIRQALFFAVKDPQAKSIFSRNMTQAVYLIDQARFVLYQGDMDRARKIMNGVMANPTEVARLP